MVSKKELGIRSVEYHDFSEANRSHSTRVDYVSRVATVCTQSTKFNPDKLYDKLHRESIGLPSSSFEFVPVCLTEYEATFFKALKPHDVEKYGEWVEDGKYLITNLRALLSDQSQLEHFMPDINRFNTDDEKAEVIKKHFHVFRLKIDIVTARQLMRHRQSWQEMSRRYVSHNKVPFMFYFPPQIEDVFSAEIDKHVKNSINLYDKMIADGAKPQDARYVIPQAAMTDVWFASTATPLKAMLGLRSEVKAQSSTREVAIAMSELLG